MASSGPNPNFWKVIFLYTFLVMVLAVLVLWWALHRKPADVTADFGGRTSTVSVPANMLGSGGVGSTVSSQSGIDNMTNVRLRGNRIWINVYIIFASGDINKPDYSLWDGQLQRGTSNGLNPLITVYGTPSPSLGKSHCSMPTDVNKWSQMAAAAVKHTDQLHPGLNYELWNEPDINGMCDNISDKLTDYLNLYAAFAPLFKAAAPTAKLGGPSLASSANTTTWIPALTTNPKTAPYVDFTSLHIYITGTWLLPGMTWQQAYDTTQNPTAGLAYYYRLFEQTTRKGSQPNAAQTPVMITEYNTNYAYQPNDVQNTAIYGPLWNMVAVADFVDVVAQGSLPPARLIYFMSADSKGYFCLEGVQGGDARMCSPPTAGQPYNAVYVPYPPLLAYQLLCAQDFMNLDDTGFNVVQPPTAPNGLMTIAVYTQTADNLVIINPTGTDVTGLKVEMKGLGIKPTRGHQFVLSKGTLAKSELRVAGADKFRAPVDVPAYSTVTVQLE